METKKCPDCGEDKALDRFGKYNPWYCKDCLNRRQKEYQRKKRQCILQSRPPAPRIDKKCGMCGEVKPIDQFNFNNKEKGWRQAYCKPCALERFHADRIRRGWDEEVLTYRCTKMGTTPEWYKSVFADQGGVCAICRQPEDHPVKRGSGKIRSLAIDHNHQSGKVRGLLCCKCNQSLHRLEKYPGWAESAVAYLLKYKGDSNGDTEVRN